MPYKYSRANDTFYSELEGEHYLLDISTAKYYILTHEAAVVWLALDKPMSVRQLTNRLLDAGEGRDEETTGKTVKRLMRQFLALHLVDINRKTS
jgi:hypothetical protein